MANEKRLIDANRLLRDPYFQKDRWPESHLIRMAVGEQPTVDAVEVVHGWWEPRTDAIGFVRCSVCHDCNIYGDWADGKKWNYCPACGAKMDGGAENGG